MIRLVLMRHGESIWNLENKFTGWTDVDLTKNGEMEAIGAGTVLKKEGFEFDVVYTSLLKRANRTMDLCLGEMKIKNVDIKYSWKLNERHYGALQGLNKAETADKYGDEQVLIWRRSYAIPPPELDINDDRHPRFDSLYSKVDPKDLPASECLKDTVDRFIPYWDEFIRPDVKNGKRVLIVAHGNSLRALVKYIDKIDDKAIKLIF